MSRRNDLLIIIVIAAAANSAYLYFSDGDFLYPDSATYLAPADSMLHRHAFESAANVPETIRTPGYPLFLLPFRAATSSAFPVVAVQHLFNIALAAAVYLFFIRRIGSRFGALLAALIFALDVPTIHYANKVLTETLFTVLLYVLFIMTLRLKQIPLAGALAGVLVLVRPVAVIYFLIVALFLVARRVPRRLIAAFLAAALVLPAGWACRNAIRTGIFSISSIGGINMIGYRAAGTLAIEDEGDFRQDLVREQAETLDDANDELADLAHVEAAEDLPDAVRARYYSRYTWRVIREHPYAFAQLTVRGVLVNLFDSDWDAIQIVSTLHPSLIQLTIDPLPIAIFIFAVIGILAMWRTDRPLALLILLTVVYFLGVSAGGESESRFRVPVIPQLAIAAAAGVELVRRQLLSLRHPVGDEGQRNAGRVVDRLTDEKPLTIG